MELRHLRYFIAVAEDLHFSRAAERLHIAQSPLSHQIHQLEAELGVQLFKRSKRRVQLTDAGQVFLQAARRTLEQCEQAVLEVQQASRGEIGRLAVGFVSAASYGILPELLRVFRVRFPLVSLVLHEQTPGEQIQALQSGQIDVGFLYWSIKDEALSYLPVMQEPLVVALPQNHPLATQPYLTLPMLAGEPFILPLRHRGPVYDLIVSMCQQAGFSPKEAQQVSLMQTMVCLVAGEIGIALVPASLQSLQRAGVIYKTLEGTIPKVEMVATWRQDNTSPVLHGFLEVVRELVKQAATP